MPCVISFEENRKKKKGMAVAAALAGNGRSQVLHARLIKAQFEPYLRVFQTMVVSSKPILQGKNRCGARWIVELDDTILFAAGGGQPSDRGTLRLLDDPALTTYDVVDVERSEDRVLHFVAGDKMPSGAVEVRLNWERRFDHMQQHSSQHLLSALAYKVHGWKTASWNLGEEVCYIDFDGGEPVDATNVQSLLALANLLITQARPFDVKVDSIPTPPSLSTSSSSSSSSSTSSTSDSVEQEEGQIRHGVRVVNISGVDDHNRCCGTHVRSTADLQAIAFAARAPASVDSKVYFWAGSRVVRRFSESLARELALSNLLSSGVERHVEAVERLQSERRTLTQKLRRTEDELVSHIVDQLIRNTTTNNSSTDSSKSHSDNNHSNGFYWLVRSEDEAFQLSKIASSFRERLPTGVLLLVSKGTGALLLSGPPPVVTAELGKQVAALLGIRGGGKAGVFQGVIPQDKVKAALIRWPELVAMLQVQVAPPVASSSSS